MLTLKKILSIFNNCSNLPVCALNNKFLLLDIVGYNDELKNLLEIMPLKKDILLKMPGQFYNYISYDNNINYLVFPIIYENNPLFILIGPFSTNEISNTYNLRYLNKDSFKYIHDLFINILKNNTTAQSLYTNNILINKALNYIYHTYCMPIKIDYICNMLNLDKCYFCKLFKKETGFTFTEYINILRIEKSKELLSNNELSLFDIAITIGYNNQSYYSKIFKKLNKKTPLEYRQTLLSSNPLTP